MTRMRWITWSSLTAFYQRFACFYCLAFIRWQNIRGYISCPIRTPSKEGSRLLPAMGSLPWSFGCWECFYWLRQTRIVSWLACGVSFSHSLYCTTGGHCIHSSGYPWVRKERFYTISSLVFFYKVFSCCRYSWYRFCLPVMTMLQPYSCPSTLLSRSWSRLPFPGLFSNAV